MTTYQFALLILLPWMGGVILYDCFGRILRGGLDWVWDYFVGPEKSVEADSPLEEERFSPDWLDRMTQKRDAA